MDNIGKFKDYLCDSNHECKTVILLFYLPPQTNLMPVRTIKNLVIIFLKVNRVGENKLNNDIYSR